MFENLIYEAINNVFEEPFYIDEKEFKGVFKKQKNESSRNKTYADVDYVVYVLLFKERLKTSTLVKIRNEKYVVESSQVKGNLFEHVLELYDEPKQSICNSGKVDLFGEQEHRASNRFVKS